MSEYINANEVKKRIENELKTAYVFDEYDSGRRDTLNWILHSVIAKLSAANVAPVVRGHWSKEMCFTEDFMGNRTYGYKCSVCGKIANRLQFCGNCGAKMDESEGER